MIMSNIDSRTMDCLVRMVVPMRREFGRSLDVSHFLHDTGYAREVLDHAGRSRDQRLRDLAACVEKAMRSVRANAVVAPPHEPAHAVAAAPAVPDHEDEVLALKASIAKKYIGGLR